MAVKLKNLTEDQYDALLHVGLLKQFFPNATGVFAEDCIPENWFPPRGVLCDATAERNACEGIPCEKCALDSGASFKRFITFTAAEMMKKKIKVGNDYKAPTATTANPMPAIRVSKSRHSHLR